MNILGMGPMEILLIVVLALIVFGPAKLPEIMGQVGKAIADFRRVTSELSDDFNRTIQAELAETKSVVEDTKSAVTGVHTSINAALSTTAAPTLTTPAPAPALTTAPTNGISTTTNGANGTNGTNGTSLPAENTPPLADTAQWSWETAAPTPSGPAVETRAPESVSSTPTSDPETPPAAATQPVTKPAERLPRGRKSAARDDLLPPY
jgi:sec-independent protein translocase protein TatB